MSDNAELIAEAREKVAPWRKRLDRGEWMTEIGLGLMVERLIDALESAQPRTVTTVEELDALPLYSVIRAGNGYVYERLTAAGWMRPSHYVLVESIHLAMLLPVTVLYTPEVSE